MITNLTEYYLRWYHERPVGITTGRREELRELHRIIYKCSLHLALNYKDYVPKWMPLGEKDLEILELQEQTPFRAGTWRPDYIIGTDGSLRICEITSRFFAHGIFMSRFAEEAADRFMARFPGAKRETEYPVLMDYMAGILEGRRKIFVLKSSDKTNEIRRKEWAADGTVVFSALNQMDILSFSLDTIKAMVDKRMFSDFRNIFLIHDKRFMKLWYDDRFTSRCLTPEETAFLRSHAIPTLDCSDPETADVLKDASENKDRYILKPYRLGKSEGVKAGILTSAAEWKSLDTSGMIIQPFISQRPYKTEWEGTEYDDYMCGMMLCVDDKYFGSGLFRASSLPVTNVGDDRKACPLLTDDPGILEYCDVL